MKRVPLLLILLALLGCDSAEYHRRMDENRLRLKILDEENARLGMPLERPQVKDKDGNLTPAWPVDIYLRSPRNVSPTPSAEEAVLIQDVSVFKYPGDPAVFVAVANIGSDKEKPKDRPPTPDEFRKRAVQGLRAQVGNEKDFFGNLQWDEKISSRTIDVPAAIAGKDRKLTFDTFVCEATATVKAEKERDTMTYSFFHYQAGDVQAIVAFQYPKGKEDSKAIELSIRTLAFDPEAASRRRDFIKTHPKK